MEVLKLRYFEKPLSLKQVFIHIFAITCNNH